MDDLHRRFRRLDRIEAPYLWNEALGRAADAELIRRPTFNPGMAMIAVALLLAAMAGTVAVGAWLNRPSLVQEIQTYDNGMIVGQVGCGQLVTLDPGSLETRPLVGDVGGCPDESGLWPRPAWSLDGKRLAYLMPWTTDDPDGAGPWLYEPATGEQRQLKQCAECFEIDISPDGSLVAYLELSREGPALTVLGVDSGEERRVMLAGPPGRPVFSPDGDKIALPVVGGRSGIYLVDLGVAADPALGTPTLLHGIVDAANLAWSPDGAWIAYTQTGRIGTGPDDDRVGAPGQTPTSGTGVVIVRADGTDARILATGPEGEGPAYPTWSPDSASIAYVTTPRDAPNQQRNVLWTVAVDGGEPARIYETDCCVDYGLPWSLSWSPDGEWIAFGVEVSDQPSESGVLLLRPDGSDVRYARGRAMEPIWQPIPTD